MAPEQVRGKRGDVRTDVYALGVMLYEMITGDLPYTHGNPHVTMRAKINQDPRPPSEVMSGTRAVRAPNGAASRKFEPSIVENTIDPSSSC